MPYVIRITLLLFCTTLLLTTFAQDSNYLKVHFLYGSKSEKKYRDTEPKWFGGILGGHVGLELDSSKILNFVPKGSFHVFAKKDKHSSYALHDSTGFYSILGGNSDSVKKAIVYIPVSVAQKQQFDSIAAAYLKQTPYDYALFGMRCGAASYEMLGQMNILPTHNYTTTYLTIFYPKKLRKRLFKKAKEEGWAVVTQDGSARRKWERD